MPLAYKDTMNLDMDCIIRIIIPVLWDEWPGQGDRNCAPS